MRQLILPLPDTANFGTKYLILSKFYTDEGGIAITNREIVCRLWWHLISLVIPVSFAHSRVDQEVMSLHRVEWKESNTILDPSIWMYLHNDLKMQWSENVIKITVHSYKDIKTDGRRGNDTRRLSVTLLTFLTKFWYCTMSKVTAWLSNIALISVEPCLSIFQYYLNSFEAHV